MEFMGFHIVDIVIVSLIAFLAIKGLVNGFSKELLNFISIVAGVILAARYNLVVVDFINEQKLVPEIPEEFAKIIGFILIVVTIWLIITFISSIISKLTATPSGFVSRLLGYILSAARYVFIFSLIIFGVSQSDFFQKSATKFKTETQLFEPMSKIGAQILNIDVNQTKAAENNATAILDVNLSEIKLTKKTPTDINISMKPKATSTEQNSSN
ncbi:MAG: Unknown protein [uncultured Sulfurovum sp.]|uniref:Colicin V production protein n=1 Tax=uncultured Sulfurovum sp. TaxID=269237 RepID=A0A6S6RSR3_9BACT|nr:MAG: Unknown protein [uncultured Sulfurovum sp.]